MLHFMIYFLFNTTTSSLNFFFFKFWLLNPFVMMAHFHLHWDHALGAIKSFTVGIELNRLGSCVFTYILTVFIVR